MTLDISHYGQYKYDIFRKLKISFVRGRSMLDVGCGDGTDAEIFIREFGLQTTAIDVYEHPRIRTINGLAFQIASVHALPFQDGLFDYVFLHDVLHHVDEPTQSRERHLAALQEVRRVTNPRGGTIVILESNRYNPLSYFHMVKMLGHDHWTQSYFCDIVKEVFPQVKFDYFEAHAYPWGYSFWRIYELVMERFLPRALLSYNVGTVSRDASS
jgi:ubiquinone/menaquinone biosynthesis C-methylase UbiE